MHPFSMRPCQRMLSKETIPLQSNCPDNLPGLSCEYTQLRFDWRRVGRNTADGETEYLTNQLRLHADAQCKNTGFFPLHFQLGCCIDHCMSDCDWIPCTWHQPANILVPSPTSSINSRFCCTSGWRADLLHCRCTRQEHNQAQRT